MVNDLLRRFIVSLVLTLPIIAFSPMGALLGLPSMPPFGLSMGLWGFVLSTPVVLWGGWTFISSAARALKRGEVNMMTLIALGILVAYVYSVGATFFFQGEPFFEAAAMLTTRAPRRRPSAATTIPACPAAASSAAATRTRPRQRSGSSTSISSCGWSRT